MAPRVETETAVLKAGGVRGIAIRPGLVYGEGKGADLPNLIALARTHGAAPHLGAGGVRQGYVHIDDLVELYVQALERAPAGTMLPPCTSHIA
jgi:nucleoside-diphosphate-sugar epimerase